MVIGSLTQKNITRRRALGVYQIVGGVLGLGLSIWVITALFLFNSVLIFMVAVAVLLYCYSIYCGILLLRNKESGLTHSIINQILQVINFSVFGYAFKFISGVFISVGIDLTKSLLFEIDAGISTWQINFNSDSDEFILNLNLVAIYLVFYIGQLKKSIEDETTLQQVTEIGNG